jgi:hypothetical protein
MPLANVFALPNEIVYSALPNFTCWIRSLCMSCSARNPSSVALRPAETVMVWTRLRRFAPNDS